MPVMLVWTVRKTIVYSPSFTDVCGGYFEIERRMSVFRVSSETNITPLRLKFKCIVGDELTSYVRSYLTTQT